jgi:thymidine phosphorylase
MSTPLGRAIGNAVEVEESLEVLAGGGPSDVVELTLALAREMLDCAGLSDVDPAEALRDGRAMDSWRAMIRAQGGDPSAKLATAPVRDLVTAGVDAYRMGIAAWRLGAGRARKEDPVSPGAGVILHKVVGDAVRAGEVLYELRADDEGRVAMARASAAEAVTIGPEPAEPQSLVLDRVS